MLTLVAILSSLRSHARSLTHEEHRHLRQINLEIVSAPDDSARWRLLEREGLRQADGTQGYADLLNELERLRSRPARNKGP